MKGLRWLDRRQADRPRGCTGLAGPIRAALHTAGLDVLGGAVPPHPPWHCLGRPRKGPGSAASCHPPPAATTKFVTGCCGTGRDRGGTVTPLRCCGGGLPAPPGPQLMLPRVSGELPPPALLPGTGWEQDGTGTVLSIPRGQRRAPGSPDLEHVGDLQLGTSAVGQDRDRDRCLAGVVPLLPVAIPFPDSLRGSPRSSHPRQRVALMAVGPGRDPGALPGPHPHDVADAFPVSADVLEPICPESSGPGAAALGSRPALAEMAEPNRVPWDHLQGTSGWGHCTESWGHPWRGPASREGWDTHRTKANTHSRDPAAPSTAPSGAEPRSCSAPPCLLPPSMIPSRSPAAAATSARGRVPICRALL